jgi:hypothetical protein
MIPWALRDLFSEFFTVGNGADKLFSDFSSVIEFAPIDHLEATDADEATFVRDFDWVTLLGFWFYGIGLLWRS